VWLKPVQGRVRGRAELRMICSRFRAPHGVLEATFTLAPCIMKTNVVYGMQ
jgi:hypothetical protein